MADLKDLYQDLILDHYRRPRNCRQPDHANRQADSVNALCGDKMTVFLLIDEGIIRDIAFIGIGCAISIASASMMTESLKGKTEAEAKLEMERFHQLVTPRSGNQPNPDTLGDLAVFSSVRDYPVRVRCATLAWNALGKALDLQIEICPKT